MNEEKLNVGEHVGTEGLTWRPRVPLCDSSLNTTRGTDSRAYSHGKIASNNGEENLTRDCEDMLIKARRKAVCLTRLYEELDLSGYKGCKFKNELIRQGYVQQVKLPPVSRGRQPCLLEVTPKGVEYLKRIGITDRPRGRGGVKHRFYQEKLKSWYKQHNYIVELEVKVGNTSLDLLVIRANSTRIGIEIALSVAYEDINATKALGAGIERLLFIVESREMMDRLRRKVETVVEGDKRSRVGYKLVWDYMQKQTEIKG